MCWVSDSSEIVFQLVVAFDFFVMCKFLSGTFGSVVTSLQPISNVVLFKLFLYGGTSILYGVVSFLHCLQSAFVLFRHYLIHQKIDCDFLRDEISFL